MKVPPTFVFVPSQMEEEAAGGGGDAGVHGEGFVYSAPLPSWAQSGGGGGGDGGGVEVEHVNSRACCLVAARGERTRVICRQRHMPLKEKKRTGQLLALELEVPLLPVAVMTVARCQGVVLHHKGSDMTRSEKMHEWNELNKNIKCMNE